MSLTKLLEECGWSQRMFADAVGVSPGTMSQIVNHGVWPKRRPEQDIRSAMEAALVRAGANAEDADAVLKSLGTGPVEPEEKEETPMIMRAQPLLDATRKHLNLTLNPFGNEVRSPDDVFLSGDSRIVREAMFLKAQHGGLMAVVGESGAGKTTLVRDFKARLVRGGKTIHVIEPYVLGMETNDKVGKTLKAKDIVEAILSRIAPQERVPLNPETRFRKAHRMLQDSCGAGWKHVVIIEEAHALPYPTLRHLKRLMDLDTGDGFTPLMSVILIGQPELMDRLSGANFAVREVTQRCEIVQLRPLDNAMEDYLAFKCKRAGVELGSLFTEDGIEAMRTRLGGSSNGTLSFIYPLAVNNMATAAMNLAAHIGAPRVDADVIEQV